jgi:hypothetical protein
MNTVAVGVEGNERGCRLLRGGGCVDGVCNFDSASSITPNKGTELLEGAGGGVDTPDESGNEED